MADTGRDSCQNPCKSFQNTSFMTRTRSNSKARRIMCVLRVLDTIIAPLDLPASSHRFQFSLLKPHCTLCMKCPLGMIVLRLHGPVRQHHGVQCERAFCRASRTAMCELAGLRVSYKVPVRCNAQGLLIDSIVWPWRSIPPARVATWK